MNRFALISLSAAAAFGMIAPAQAQLLKSQFKFTHEASGYEVKANRNGETLNLIGNNPVDVTPSFPPAGIRAWRLFCA